jgi:glycine/D-amino acid oxidase-like deaminating enzyme
VKPPAAPWLIVGQGLAGTCLAWQLWWRGIPFLLTDRGAGGSSRVAAGLINPITGKNFEPSKYLSSFLPEAMVFYLKVESILQTTVWHPMPVLRLASSPDEWAKIQAKLTRPDVARWIAGNPPHTPEGWHAATLVLGGGRLDTRAFLDGSRDFFQQHKCYRRAEFDDSADPSSTILCQGAAGLLTDRTDPHRCAKGEILTVRADHWHADHIRVGGGGWLVPIGSSLFKVGSTYEWDQLDENPTSAGLSKVSAIAQRLADADFEIIAHEAGIRPILRRSEPLIGPLPSGHWFFNGLGSKGSLYAPATARRLADWLATGTPPDPEFDIRPFLGLL